ncbi:MAG: trypsin-like peptidase domain-containing protein [Lachnospiraceae bacterium]|nr:trypsin-like peptidase domain-containing protein [Candidatus Equihabitans merdae]
MKDYRHYNFNDEFDDIDEYYRPTSEEIYRAKEEKKKNKRNKVTIAVAGTLAAVGIAGGAVFASSMPGIKANDGESTLMASDLNEAFEGTDIPADQEFVDEKNTDNILDSILGKTKDSDDQASSMGLGDIKQSTASEELTTEEVARKVMPSMVAITNTSIVDVQDIYGGFFGNMTPQQQEQVSMGTGVIIAQDGDDLYIVTNQHVVNGAKSLSVAFVDDATAEATIVGEDAVNDLAVIKVKVDSLDKATKDAIAIVSVGDFDEVCVGQKVIAIGNALGYGQSVSEGIVSALNRSIESSEGVYGGGLLQTDAAINPGNSGGALLNTRGELIGINSAKFASTEVEGMGFAIPISTAAPIVEQMITGQGTSSANNEGVLPEENGAYLGINCIGVDEDKAAYYDLPAGIYVQETVSGGAAATAGISEGDVILNVDGQKTGTVDELTTILNQHKPGDQVTIEIARPGQKGSYISGNVQVTLGSRNM